MLAIYCSDAKAKRAVLAVRLVYSFEVIVFDFWMLAMTSAGCSPDSFPLLGAQCCPSLHAEQGFVLCRQASDCLQPTTGHCARLQNFAAYPL